MLNLGFTFYGIDGLLPDIPDGGDDGDDDDDNGHDDGDNGHDDDDNGQYVVASHFLLDFAVHFGIVRTANKPSRNI